MVCDMVYFRMNLSSISLHDVSVLGIYHDVELDELLCSFIIVMVSTTP